MKDGCDKDADHRPELPKHPADGSGQSDQNEHGNDPFKSLRVALIEGAVQCRH